MSDGKVLKSPAMDKNTFRVNAPPLPEFRPLFTQIAEIEEEEKKSTDGRVESVNRFDESADPEVAVATLELDYKSEAETIITTAKEEAATIITTAKEEAAALLEEARIEIETLKAEVEASCKETAEKGYEAGFQQGYTEGNQKAEAELAEKIKEAEDIRDEAASYREKAKEEGELIRKEAEEERTRRILESEDEILKLAIDIAEKIIRKQISRSDENWFEIVKAAVKKVAGATEVTIRVSAEDEAYLIQHLSEVQNLLTEAPSIRVVADSSLEPGDLVIQSNLGQLDARIKQQLAAMLKSLREEAVG